MTSSVRSPLTDCLLLAVPGDLARERFQEFDKICLLLPRELQRFNLGREPFVLVPTLVVEGNHFFQGLLGAIVHVRSSTGNLPQCRGLESPADSLVAEIGLLGSAEAHDCRVFRFKP